MVKMTFTFDEQTVRVLRQTASKLKRPQSAVVREAIQDFASRADRLSDEERKRMLNALDRAIARAPEHSKDEIDEEIAEIRRLRRTTGRRTRTR